MDSNIRIPQLGNPFFPLDYERLLADPAARLPGTFSLSINDKSVTMLVRVNDDTLADMENSQRVDLCWTTMPYEATRPSYVLGIRASETAGSIVVSDRLGHRHCGQFEIQPGNSIKLVLIGSRPRKLAKLGEISARMTHNIFLQRTATKHPSRKVDFELDNAEVANAHKYWPQIQNHRFWKNMISWQRLR